MADTDAPTIDLVTDAIARDTDAWTTRARLRAACRQSLYFFTKTVVCLNKTPNLLTAVAFKESCDWVQAVVVDHKRGLFEDPRNTTKSTRSTLAVPNWLAIQRASVELDLVEEVERSSAFLAKYRHIKGPDTRVAIASETKDKAAEWSAAVKRQWETNGLLRYLFPELVWASFDRLDYGSWDSAGWYLPGREDPTDPNPFLRAIGLVSAISGARLDVILVDDLVSEKSAESPTEMRFRRTWLMSATQLLEVQNFRDPGGSSILLTENRWGLDDPNSMIHDELSDWSVWSRSLNVCGVHGYGNCGRQRSDEQSACTATELSIWPERHPDLDAVRRTVGDYNYFTQSCNKPLKKAVLDPSKLVPFHLAPRAVASGRDGAVRRELCVIPDTAAVNTDGSIPIIADEAIPLSSLALHAISVDPAGADEASAGRLAGRTSRWAFGWHALDAPTGRVMWLDCRADHWTPDEAIERLLDMWIEVAALIGIASVGLPILCEKVAAQTLVGSALRFAAQGRRIDPPVVRMIPIPRQSRDARVRQRLGWRLGQSRLWLRAGLTLPRVELAHFPTGSRDTLITEVLFEDLAMEAQGITSTDTDGATRRRVEKRRRAEADAGVTGVW